jgi:hypothetical protein
LHDISHEKISIYSLKGSFVFNRNNICKLISSFVKKDIKDIFWVGEQISPRNDPILNATDFLGDYLIIFPVIALEKILNIELFTLFFKIILGKIGWANSSFKESLSTG